MTSTRARCVRAIASTSLALLAGAVAAQTPTTAAPAAGTIAPAEAPLRPARPYFIELTQAQRQALAPLADDWERLDVQTKKKWVEIANRYPRMNPDEQARTQQRMREWALLTPEQRRVARDSFARVRQMPPEQRAEMLRKYQELPPEKRQALVIEGRTSKAIVVPKPSPTPLPRRTQLSEGAKTPTPAQAAERASPLVAPSRPPVAKPAAPVPAAPLPAVPAGAPPAASSPAAAAPAPVAPAPAAPNPAAPSGTGTATPAVPPTR